jgi:hypothetical protein
MRAHVPLTWILALAAMLAVPERTAAADGEAFKVIVNPENPIDTIDRKFLRDAYLKKANDWRGGETLRPIDLSTKYAVRGTFVRDVLKKTPAQLKTYWNQQIFSGKGVPPPETATIADVVAYVLAHKGAVAYLPADADPGKAKVVGIR